MAESLKEDMNKIRNHLETEYDAQAIILAGVKVMEITKKIAIGISTY